MFLYSVQIHESLISLQKKKNVYWKNQQIRINFTYNRFWALVIQWSIICSKIWTHRKKWCGLWKRKYLSNGWFSRAKKKCSWYWTDNCLGDGIYLRSKKHLIHVTICGILKHNHSYDRFQRKIGFTAQLAQSIIYKTKKLHQ